MSFTQQQQQQRTFEAANASDASIVKPTLPRNVLEEFQEFVHSGRRGSDLQPAAFEPPVAKQQPTTTKPVVPARPAPSAVSAPQVDPKLQQMLGGIRAILVKNKQAMTLSDLSNQIKQFSGQSWGGHWEHEYGNLTLFLKSHPEHFSVVKNKYVVVAGQEHLAQRQLEADLQAAASAAVPPLAYQTATPPPAYQATPPPQYYDDPFGVVTAAPQQQYYQESSFYQDQPSFYQEPLPSTQTYYQEPPSSYYQPPPQQQQQWWEQQQQQQSDAYYYQQQQQQQRDRELQLQREREQQQREREQQERREREEQLEIQRQLQREKEQWEADEEMARKLQQEEFARANKSAPARAPSTSSSRETVVFTTSQMRDLAEREIGIDNVRIIAGFSVKKFGREGRPHQRKIWVTQSLTHVAWQSSLMEGNHRGIELKYVTQVASGQMTPTIARATGDSARVRALCFSLITQARTLDMEACSVVSCYE